MKRRNGPIFTREVAAKIKAFLAHTELNHAEIAARLGGINQGRISEVKNGQKFPEVQPCELEFAGWRVEE